MRALVTGGTGRIGSAIAARLERDGWKVKAAGRNDGDVAQVGQARRLVAQAVEKLGGLDLLVNAAGEGFAPKPVEDLEETDWEAAFYPRFLRPEDRDRPDQSARPPDEPRAVAGYRLLRRVGEGGMSTVFLSYDVPGRRAVAVKVLADHLAGQKEFVNRFYREARLSRSRYLQHPNIVRGIAAGYDPNTRSWRTHARHSASAACGSGSSGCPASTASKR